MRRLALALLLLAGLLASPAAAGPRPVLDWLRYDPGLLRAYSLTMDAADSARQTLSPIWAGAAAPVHRVLLLVPIKSVDAYSISVNTVLSVFRERAIPARFEVWFYGNDKAVAAESLAWAEANGIELIMTVGSLATEYIHGNYRGHRIPVVTAASKDPVPMGQMPGYDVGSGTNIAYTSINVAIETEITYLRRLIPELREVAVIYAANNKSAVETQVRPLQAVAAKHRLTIREVVVRDEEHAVEDINRSVPAMMTTLRADDPDLRHSVMLVTGSTTVYDQIGLINRFTGRLPVAATLPDVVRQGDDSAVLSIGVNQSSAVQIAALYGIDILLGKVKAGDLKVGLVSTPDIAISFRRAREIDLLIPFSFFEAATFIYDYEGRQVRSFGLPVVAQK